MQVGIDELSGPDAHAVIAGLRAREPVAWVPAVAGWLVTGYDLAVEVMRNHVVFTVDDPRFSTAQVVGSSMLSLDGPDHLRHRAPFLAAFRPSRVEHTFAAPVRSLAAGLVDQVRPDGHADLRVSLAGPLSVAVMVKVLGLRGVDAATVLDWYAAIAAAVSALSAGTGPDAAAEPAPASLDAASRAVAALAEHISGGLCRGSILAAAREHLAEAEVIANAAVMMFGGIETTEAMIANAVLHLLDNPAAFAEVRGDPSLVPAAVEESLRLEPAAAVIDRYATRDTVLDGVGVRFGELVRVSIAGANRDPAVFIDPDRFDLHRPNARAQLSFARGPHACIATDLARLEAGAAVRAVLDLPRLRTATPVAPTGLVFRKPSALRVRWELS